MDRKPKKSWFRFRLSTVLILTAIAAWGMPLCERSPVLVMTRPTTGEFIEIDHFLGHSNEIEKMQIQFPRWQPSVEYRLVVDARMIQPTLALFAFLAWKAAGAVVERRRREVLPE
ncbi:MAG: hypothetical protein K2Y37_08175 [Pirellulales bacterium]|nr:hypothetical protein [Pirellulales bacterium]